MRDWLLSALGLELVVPNEGRRAYVELYEHLDRNPHKMREHIWRARVKAGGASIPPKVTRPRTNWPGSNPIHGERGQPGWCWKHHVPKDSPAKASRVFTLVQPLQLVRPK